MQIIDGTQIASQIYNELRTKLNGSTRKLAILMATDNPAAQTYVSLKQKQAQALGLTVDIIQFPVQAKPTDIFDRINLLAEDASVNGIMIQLPLYPILQPDSAIIANLIPSEKDVDGLTAYSQGTILQNLRPFYYPATVAAILEALRHCLAPTESYLNTAFQAMEPKLRGRQVVIINHSNLVGKPLAAALINLNATVTVAHEFTANLSVLTQAADIVISATGKPGILNADMFKPGAIVIDVTSVKTDLGIRGDVTVTPALESKISWMTPVPGGIGPLTVACLLRNLVLGPTV